MYQTTATGRQSLQRRDIIIIIRISGRCVLTETDQGVKLIILWFRKNIVSGIILERKRRVTLHNKLYSKIDYC